MRRRQRGTTGLVSEAVRAEETDMPVLRFTPGSLRALARLVKALRMSMPAEANHGNPNLDVVEHSTAGGIEADGRAGDRFASASTPGPDRLKGGAP